MNVPHLFGRVAIAAGILLGSLAAQATEFRSSDIHPEDSVSYTHLTLPTTPYV